MKAQLKQQLVSFLSEAARAGISKLDKNSPFVRALDGLDVDTTLREDIHQICEAMSFAEMVKVLSLVAAIKLGRQDTQRPKADIKKIAKVIEERIEKKRGGLKTPPSCRELLFDL